jgi:hypothetical protein
MRDHQERLERLSITDFEARKALVRVLKRGNDPRAALLSRSMRPCQTSWLQLRKHLNAIPAREHATIAAWLDPFLSHWDDDLRRIHAAWMQTIVRAKPCPLIALCRAYFSDDDADAEAMIAHATALTHLTSLNLYGARVRDVSGLVALPHLTSLALQTEAPDVSALATLHDLTSLHLYGAEVGDVSALATLTNLKYLSLRGPKVRDLSPLSALTHLKTLNILDTQARDVSALAGLTHLTSLDITGMQVRDVSALQTLTRLEYLSLNGTQVSDLRPLKDLINLRDLSLDSTQVSDLSALANLTHLKTLTITQTPAGGDAGKAQVEALREKLPHCEVRAAAWLAWLEEERLQDLFAQNH